MIYGKTLKKSIDTLQQFKHETDKIFGLLKKAIPIYQDGTKNIIKTAQARGRDIKSSLK